MLVRSNIFKELDIWDVATILCTVGKGAFSGSVRTIPLLLVPLMDCPPVSELYLRFLMPYPKGRGDHGSGLFKSNIL